MNPSPWARGSALIGALLVCLVASITDSQPAPCPATALDVMPCALRVISSVEVTFQGDLLKQHKADFERLIRLRLRNDLSMLAHEERNIVDVFKEADYRLRDAKVKERGAVNCFVWTVGKDNPVSVYVECTLTGWGIFDVPIYEKFTSKHLGHSPAQRSRDQVDSMIRDAITEIGSDFLDARDRMMKPR